MQCPGDNVLAKHELDLQSTLSLEDGLDVTIEWFHKALRDPSMVIS